jgi:hypothetical protein
MALLQYSHWFKDCLTRAWPWPQISVFGCSKQRMYLSSLPNAFENQVSFAWGLVKQKKRQPTFLYCMVLLTTGVSFGQGSKQKPYPLLLEGPLIWTGLLLRKEEWKESYQFVVALPTSLGSTFRTVREPSYCSVGWPDRIACWLRARIDGCFKSVLVWRAECEDVSLGGLPACVRVYRLSESRVLFGFISSDCVLLFIHGEILQVY